jgi:hypothetical protein
MWVAGLVRGAGLLFVLVVMFDVLAVKNESR